MPTRPTITPRARAVWALIITSTAGFMAALDNLVVTTALPSIRAELGGELTALEWTVNSFTLTFAVLLMFGAALGDRFGRRRMFGIGLSVFTVASAGAALSTDIGMLIAARAAQGLGAAIMMPLTLTLLTAAVPAAKRGAALGIWGAVNGLAVALGPLVGGGLTEHLSWHWIFWINVPIGLVLLPLARRKLAESTGADPRLDVVGTVLASAGLFGIVYGLVNAGSEGWTDPLVLTALVGGASVLAGFVGHQLRARHPMLPMRLFRGRAFSGINASSLLMYVGMFGAIFLLSQYLQNVGGYSPTEAGLRMLPWTAMPMLVSPIAGLLSDRIGGGRVVATGLALQALGLAWFAVTSGAQVDYQAMLPALVLSGLGMSCYFAPAANVVMSSVRVGEQGIASGTNNALREVGGALGIAVLSTVFASLGGYGSPAVFVDGLRPALWIGAAVVAAGAAVALLIPRLPAHRDATADTDDTPTAVATASREPEQPGPVVPEHPREPVLAESQAL